MFGPQPAIPVSVFSSSYLIKSCEHDTKMAVGKRGKERETERGGERGREEESTLRPSEIYKYTESIKP